MTADSLQVVPQSSPSAPALRAADQGVANALESVLSDNTRRVYDAQWRLFDEWCDDVDFRSLPTKRRQSRVTWQCAPAPPSTLSRAAAKRTTGCRRSAKLYHGDNA